MTLKVRPINRTFFKVRDNTPFLVIFAIQFIGSVYKALSIRLQPQNTPIPKSEFKSVNTKYTLIDGR